MKLTSKILQHKWNNINFYDGGYIRVDVDSFLEWYIGYKDINQKTLLIVSHFEPKLLPTSKSVLISKGLREDGRWALSMTLMRPEQEGVFAILCSDIINYTGKASSEHIAMHLTENRYKQWHRLMEHQNKGLMDESRRKGLLGELLFLYEKLKSGYPIISAVQGWVGPDGADQDFIYNDLWYEIKSVGVSAETVSISSLEQLDNLDPGELVVIRIDKCPPEKPESFTLNDQVKKVADLIKDDPDAPLLFESKLVKYGYIDLSEYGEQRYFFTKKDLFNVTDDFPRLTSAAVMPQIASAQYSISLSAIEGWRLEE